MIRDVKFMKKNVFRVFAIETIIIFIYFLMSIVLYVCFLIDATDDELNRLAIIFTIMFVCLPIILFIWSFYTKWPTIELDENGIKKYLFHKELVSMDWNHIVDIKKFRSGWAVWIFISSSKMESNSMNKLKKRKDIIYFYESERAKKIFLDNIPKNIKDMYESKSINRAEI